MSQNLWGAPSVSVSDSRRVQARKLLRRAALREAAYLVGLLATAAVVYGVLVLVPSKMKTRDVVEQHAEVSRGVAELKRVNASLKADAQALHEDPWTVERALRGRLGYLRPGERVFRGAPGS